MIRSASKAVSLDWHQSPEGQGVLAHLNYPNSNQRKRFGFLERPLLPPTVQINPFKLFLFGKAGVGKTKLISLLNGHENQETFSSFETPGQRVTQVFWPAKIQHQIHLFKLGIWDSGDNASKKFTHILPAARDGADAVILLFSFLDKHSLIEIDAQLNRLALSNLCIIVIGNRFGVDKEVTQQDISHFESKWKLPVLRVRQFPNPSRGVPASQNRQVSFNEIAYLLNLICDQIWCYRLERERSRQVYIEPALI